MSAQSNASVPYLSIAPFEEDQPKIMSGRYAETIQVRSIERYTAGGRGGRSSDPRSGRRHRFG